MAAMRLTLRQLQIFAAIASNGTTAAAGNEVGLSQSATSSALNELERLLSRQLFDRTGKRLVLNDNGRQLLPRALALLDAAAEIERQGDGQGAVPPSLRIGASTTIGNYVLPHVLRHYMARWPDAGAASHWHSRVVIGNTAEICRLVADFQLDVGLIEGPSHEPQLDTLPWVNDELVIVASPETAAKIGALETSSRVPLKMLREQVWLLRESGSGTRVATDSALLPHLHAYRRSMELGSSEAIKHAAAEGLGIACLSQWVVSEMVRSSRLVRLNTTMPRLVRPFYVVLHREKGSTAGLQDLLSHLAAMENSALPATWAPRKQKSRSS